MKESALPIFKENVMDRIQLYDLPIINGVIERYSKQIAVEDMRDSNVRIDILEYQNSMKTRKSKLVN